jgi:hypothetical protein
VCIQAAGFKSDGEAEVEKTSLEVRGKFVAVEKVEAILRALEAVATVGRSRVRAGGGRKAPKVSISKAEARSREVSSYG